MHIAPSTLQAIGMATTAIRVNKGGCVCACVTPGLLEANGDLGGRGVSNCCVVKDNKLKVTGQT